MPVARPSPYCTAGAALVGSNASDSMHHADDYSLEFANVHLDYDPIQRCEAHDLSQ
jgi:hypothetical protein